MTHSRFKLFPVAAAAALAIASCANEEEVQLPPSGNEIRFTTRVSRATETDLAVLQKSEGFKVYADVDDWTNFFINGDTARYDGTSAAFVLNKKYNWSSDMKKIQFWAFHPIDDKIVKPEISASNIRIDDFTPVASLTKPYNVGSFTNAGPGQSDLIIAYTEAEFGKVSNNAVPLNFQHALAQVEVKIKNAEASTDGRKIVKIAGACIVNAKNKGNLEFHAHDAGATEADDSRFTITDLNDSKYDIVWNTASATLASYGQALLGDVKLNVAPGSESYVISNDNKDNSSLMLVPQKTTKYNFSTPNEGSYILLLCRVEIHHPGETHTGTKTETTTGGTVGSDGKGGHIHQLFPELQSGDTYNEKAYGYTCVPVDFDWKPGLRHIYHLNFLGANAGAGQYPPTDHPAIKVDDSINVIPKPDDKKPGDLVLDNPITFTVTVAEWKDADQTPTPMP